MLNFVLDFLKDRNDGSSFKRLTGFLCFVISVIIAFTSRDFNLCSLFLGCSMGESVATLFERDKKNVN